MNSLKIWIKSRYALIFFVIVFLDQLTKLLAAAYRVNVTIIPQFFYLSYSRNTGAAWSIFEGGMVYLAIVSFVVGTGLGFYYIKKFKTFHWLNHVAITLFLAGTWGNFIDRAFYQEGVIDFLSFHFGSYIFPTFNVADSALTIGVILLIISSIFEEKLGLKNE